MGLGWCCGTTPWGLTTGLFRKQGRAGNWFKICPSKQTEKAPPHNTDSISPREMENNIVYTSSSVKGALGLLVPNLVPRVLSYPSLSLYRVFSHDVTAAISVSQNNETAAMLVSRTNPLGVELFSYANIFFCSNKFA